METSKQGFKTRSLTSVVTATQKVDVTLAVKMSYFTQNNIMIFIKR